MQRFPLAVLGLLAGAGIACRAPHGGEGDGGGATADEPYALLLGMAQDGGRPQIGCAQRCCAGAERVLVVDPRAGRRWLVDASPDLCEQVALADGHPPTRVAHDAGDPGDPRPPLFDGIFLTHAHMGHYAGLLELGREAYGARGTVVHASPRMADFLEGNAPWSALFGPGLARLERLAPGRSVELGDRLTLTAIAVPHREEFSDTLAFRIDGPRRTLLYAPDTDRWEGWDPPIEALLDGVDVALLDGTFFAPGEVPGRDLSEVPHPFLESSIERFSHLPRAVRARIRFVHLNHTNPAFDPASAARAALDAAGLGLGRTGERFEL